MPWCPKCKHEYIDGITICADCKVALIQSLDHTSNERNTHETIETSCTSDKEPSDYDDYVREDTNFLETSVDTLENDSISDFDEENSLNDSEEENSLLKSTGGAYVMKEDAYKEHRSTASMFFVFSIAGLIFLGLNVIGIIQYINGLFSYLVMGALFVTFFYFGIDSMRKAKEISTGIDAEKEMTQKINTYLKSLGEIASIDEADWSGLNDELLFFKRTTKLKQMVIQNFGAQNEAYLDVIIEDYYNTNV